MRAPKMLSEWLWDYDFLMIRGPKIIFVPGLFHPHGTDHGTDHGTNRSTPRRSNLFRPMEQLFFLKKILSYFLFKKKVCSVGRNKSVLGGAKRFVPWSVPWSVPWGRNNPGTKMARKHRIILKNNNLRLILNDFWRLASTPPFADS